MKKSSLVISIFAIALLLIINNRCQMGKAQEKSNYTDLSLYSITGEKLSGITTANCYVVSSPGKYKIPMVYGNAIKEGKTNTAAYTSSAKGENILKNFKDHKGNGIYTGESGSTEDAEKAIDPWVSKKYAINKAGIIWQDAKELVTNIAITGEAEKKEAKYITFEVTQESFTQGNAIIAAYDSEGLVAWSYHIWVYDNKLQTEEFISRNGVKYNFLTVNLGYCEPNSEKSRNGGALGNYPFYEWGRKDPMLPSNGNAKGKGMGDKIFYGPTGAAQDSSFCLATFQNLPNINKIEIKELIQMPGYYFSGWEENYINSWGSPVGKECNLENDTEAAKVVKTIYDPSPVGFCVPPIGAFVGFLKEGTESNKPENLNLPASFQKFENSAEFRYSFGGYLIGEEAKDGYYSPFNYWSATTGQNDGAYSLSISNNQYTQIYVFADSMMYPSYGYAVRPIVEP